MGNNIEPDNIEPEIENTPEVSLRPVDHQNWKSCVDMSVASDQEPFVAENWYSLLQWKFSDNMHPYCIYADETMVGFIMYALDTETHRWFLLRFMVDFRHQGNGYGKAALSLLIDKVRESLGNISFYTCVEEDNKTALKLYEDAGFERTGELYWDELLLKIQL